MSTILEFLDRLKNDGKYPHFAVNRISIKDDADGPGKTIVHGQWIPDASLKTSLKCRIEIEPLQAPEKGAKDKPLQDDPLKGYTALTASYGALRIGIEQHHEHAKVPALNTPAELKQRQEFTKLVTVDKFPQTEVSAVIYWLYEDYAPASSGFDWRDQVQSVLGLRTCKNGGLSKFAKIHAAWKKDRKAGDDARQERMERIGRGK